MSKSKDNVESFAAMKEWLSIPEAARREFLSNVFCVKCSGVTTIIDYTVSENKFGVVLKGKCKACNHSVARVIER